MLHKLWRPFDAEQVRKGQSRPLVMIFWMSKYFNPFLRCPCSKKWRYLQGFFPCLCMLLNFPWYVCSLYIPKPFNFYFCLEKFKITIIVSLKLSIEYLLNNTVFLNTFRSKFLIYSFFPNLMFTALKYMYILIFF